MYNKIKNKLLVSIVGFVFLLFVFKGLSEPNISYDEAGQFWISKGLNHFSPYESVGGGLPDVLIQNKTYNLDPGGFSLIAYFWLKVSNSIPWIRLLPFLFSLVSLYFLNRIFILLELPKDKSILFSLFFFLSNSLTEYSFIFRAYSYEIAGVILSLYILIYYREKLNTIDVMAKLSTTLIFFVFSRYGFIIHIIALGLLLIYLLTKDKKWTTKVAINFIIVFVVPIFLTVFVIYSYQLSNQININNFEGYQKPYTLKYKSFIELFKINFLTRRGLPFTILCICMLLNYFKPFFKITKHFKIFFTWALLMHVVTIIFSLFGYYPWYIKQRWGLTLEFISLFSLLMLIDKSFMIIFNNINLIRNYKLEIVSFLIVIVLYTRFYHSESPCLKLLDLFRQSNTKNAIINWYLTPAARYHLKFNNDYPELMKEKEIKFEGIDKIRDITLHNWWILIENPDTNRKLNLSKYKFNYGFIINESSYQIIEVQ